MDKELLKILVCPVTKGPLVYDKDKNEYFIARDHMGIIPLYMGWDKNGTFYVASELKALEGVCTKIELFPPGHSLNSGDSKPKRWYETEWDTYESVKDNLTSIETLHDALSDAVHRQLMSDVPYGVLLSGGLDSTIISSIINDINNENFLAYSIGYNEYGYNEFEYSKLAATKLNMKHQILS